jgi:hypothetical protein
VGAEASGNCGNPHLRSQGSALIVAGMTESENANQPSRRARAARKAGEIRRRRLAAVRERETQIESTVVDVLAARLALDEARFTIAEGVGRLKALGETQEGIGDLCEMSVAEVRAALALTRETASTSEAEAGAAARRW